MSVEQRSSASHRIIFIASLLAVSSTACSVLLPDLPKTGAPATGQPLSFREERRRELERYKEQVGTIRDEGGNKLGNIYETGTRVRELNVWYGYQGREYIDAEDYFRIAGDTASQTGVHRARRMAYLMNRGGWITAAGGLGMLLLSSLETDVRPHLALAGVLGLIIGPTFGIWGSTRLAAERHGVPAMSAAMAAERYNQQLHDSGARGDAGKATRVGMGWSF